MEANAHWMSKNATETEDVMNRLKLEVTEMNAAGSVPIKRLNNTHWKTDEKEDPKTEIVVP